MKQFPKKAFMVRDRNADTGEDLLAYREELEAIERRGVTYVAEYELVAVRLLATKPHVEKETKLK
jgi:hypothetical protein